MGWNEVNVALERHIRPATYERLEGLWKQE